MHKFAILMLPAAIAGGGLFAPAVAAPAIDPHAQQILMASIKTYQSLKSYRDTAVLATVAPAGKDVSYQSIAWKAPRYLNVVTTYSDSHARDNYDGQRYNLSRRDADGVYVSQQPLPDVSYGRQVVLQYMPMGQYFTPFLAGINPLQAPLGMRITALKMGPAATLGGVRVDTLIASPQDAPGNHLIYLIGQKDHLVRRIIWEGVTVDNDKYTVTETHSDIQVNPTFAAAAFDFVPPADARVPPMDVEESDESLREGQVAPAFTAPDVQQQTLSLEQYHGKVLLLDFWASWCLPCRFQMPYLKMLYQKYHDRGFEIVGVSQDEKLSDLQQLVREDALPWRQIHDADYQTSLQYKAATLPSNALIGRDGKIVALNQDKLLLDAAIRKALDAGR